MCVELAPPGGMTLEIGVLFANLRGFTSDSASRTPAEVSRNLRRFYAHAEKVFFPETLIDKLIGDEVMALYVPPLMSPAAASEDPTAAIDDDVRRHTTASRLQGHAAGGEVILSARLAQILPTAVGMPERIVLKGKPEPFDVRRIQWFGQRL